MAALAVAASLALLATLITMMEDRSGGTVSGGAGGTVSGGAGGTVSGGAGGTVSGGAGGAVSGGASGGTVSATAGGSHPFSRAPSRKRAIVWAVGDGADGHGPAKALAHRMARGRFDRFLYLGDVYEYGTNSDFLNHYDPVYGRVAKKTAPTPGNHDWPRHTTGYDRYWKRITGRRPPDHYSFSLAGWRILSLNSEARHSEGSAQVRWLKRQLRGPGTCRLAFWHSPRYSAGTVHGDRPDLAPFWNALKGHAVLVVNGHSHNSQQLRAIDGITTLIAGSGGHVPRHGLNRSDPRLVFGNNRLVAGLRLILKPGRAGFAFITASGQKLRSGSLPCVEG